MLIYIILIILAVLFIIYKILLNINNALLFYPIKTKLIDKKYFKTIENKYNIKIENGIITSSDNCKIHYIFLNNNNNNNNTTGTIFLFAHGNSGNISNRLENQNIKFLLKLGSVILFDYRGYGYSTGEPSEQGLKDDILAIWNHITKTLKYEPDNIILYGESLGCSCVSWLGSYLTDNNMKLPKSIIMQSGYYSLKEVASDLFHPILSYLVLNEFNNNKYIKNIKNNKKNYLIILLHSKKDGMINYNHSNKLATENYCIIHEIQGTHNNPEFNNETYNLIKNI